MREYPNQDIIGGKQMEIEDLGVVGKKYFGREHIRLVRFTKLMMVTFK